MPPDRLYEALRVQRERGWIAALSPRALRVHFVLLDYYNWAKGRAWPSYNTLCRDTGLSRSAVREALKELVYYGLWEIARTQPGGNGPRRLNIYRLPEIVPDVPAKKYRPGAKWTRSERLHVLSAEGRGSAKPATKEVQSRALNLNRSRALNSDQSRGPCKDRFSALGGNYVVNNALEQRNEQRSADDHDQNFHSQETPSPNGERQRRETVALRYRDFLRQFGEYDREARDAVARALAAELRCPEGEANLLLGESQEYFSADAAMTARANNAPAIPTSS